MTKHLSLEQIIACGFEPEAARSIMPQLNQWLESLPAIECWQTLTQKFLTPNHPFALHELLHQVTFSEWDARHSLPPAWFPSDHQINATNIAALMNELSIASYEQLHAWSVQHRAEFWQRMIDRVGIRFSQPYNELVDLSNGAEYPQWLVNARLNIVDSCFQAASEKTAIVGQSQGKITHLSYGELNHLTNRIANGIANAGFQTGDAIAIMMPMTVEAVAIYLGIIKAGCVVVSIADSFSAIETATRLNIAQAKAIFTQDYIIRNRKKLPLYEKVIAANAPKAIVLPSLNDVEWKRSEDLTWKDFLDSNDQFDAIPARPEAHTNILFSSGTTGEPKAIPWTQTTPIKCAIDAHLHHDIHPGDVLAWSTNLGWMMGPWLIYASLINQATIALYDGSPNDRAYGEFIQNARVTLLGVVPSLVSTWKSTHCMQELDWSAIKAFSSTGECSNPRDMLYLMSLANYKPVIEYCGGTEIGGAYITGTPVQPCIPATFSTPALGLDFVLLDEQEQLVDRGEVFLIPPSIGLSTELLNKDHHAVYFADTPSILPCLRRHGDQLERLPNGYYRAQGRVDDTMNLSGIKISAIEIEQVLNTVDGIRETAAIAVSPPEGGPSQLIIYATVTPELQLDKAALQTRLQTAIKQRLNPLFKIYDVAIVETLPRTASNKLMRRLLRDLYQ